MSNIVTITVGTDGPTDYIKTPDGQKFNLGAMSVLNIIAGLAKSNTIAKKTLGTFLREKEAMMVADLDKLRLMLPKHVVRFYSSNPLMSHSDRKAMKRGFESLQSNSEQAELIIDKLAAVNTKIDILVSEGRKFRASDAKEDLLKIASKLETLIASVDMAEDWVGEDLSNLRKQADTMCAAFKV